MIFDRLGIPVDTLPIIAWRFKSYDHTLTQTRLPIWISVHTVSYWQHCINVNVPMQQHNIPNTWGTFDGSVTKWKQLRDRFKESMHDNKDVSLATKILRLQDSLKGKAAQALGQRHFTADNYMDAWKRLNELYDRPYVIASEFMRQFYRLPQLQSSPTANELNCKECQM